MKVESNPTIHTTQSQACYLNPLPHCPPIAPPLRNFAIEVDLSELRLTSMERNGGTNNGVCNVYAKHANIAYMYDSSMNQSNFNLA